MSVTPSFRWPDVLFHLKLEDKASVEEEFEQLLKML